METNAKFRQKRKWSGGLMNDLMGNNDTIPVVGKGVTQLHYSDRTPYEVIEVSKDLKTVKLEVLDAVGDTSKDKLEMGHQNWILNSTGKFFTVIWKWGKWRTVSNRVRFTEAFIKEAMKAGYTSPAAYSYKVDKERHNKIYQDEVFPQAVIEGITEEYKEYNPINLLFGRKEYYYDWSF